MGDRKGELLQFARRSRIKWILDAAEKRVQDDNPEASKRTILPLSPVQTSIPAASCIQEVLSLLDEFVGDGELVNVDSLVLGLPEDDMDDVDDECIELTSRKTPYMAFLDRLRSSKATEIVKSLQQFVTKFDNSVSTLQSLPSTLLSSSSIANTTNAAVTTTLSTNEDDKVAMIWTFLDHLFVELRQCSVWSEETDAEFSITKISCEKFLFIKLHKFIYNIDVEDAYNNAKLRDKLSSLAFLMPIHLDIKSLSACTAGQIDGIFEVAIQELHDMYKFNNPIDKVGCIKRCCVALGKAISHHKSGGSIMHNTDLLPNIQTESVLQYLNVPGADEVLSLLILALTKCNPVELHSNMKYLQKYTHPDKFTSETGYLITQFVSAVHFLDNVDAKALTISPEEYESSVMRCKEEGVRLVEQNEAMISKKRADMSQSGVGILSDKQIQSLVLQSNDSVGAIPIGNVYSIYKKINRGDDAAPESIGRNGVENEPFFDKELTKQIMSLAHHDQPVTATSPVLGAFLHRGIESITVADIPDLLREYKILAKACKRLCK